MPRRASREDLALVARLYAAAAVAMLPPLALAVATHDLSPYWLLAPLLPLLGALLALFVRRFR